MTVAAWPIKYLPRPLADGYGLQPMPSTIRTDMDNATARVRRRFTRQMTTASLNFNFTRLQYGLFDGFWRGTLGDGSAWCNIILRNGISDDVWTVRGVAPFKSQMISPDVWRVSWEVEVDQMPQLSAGDLEGLLAEGVFEYANDALSLYSFCHVQYPADSIAPLGP